MIPYLRINLKALGCPDPEFAPSASERKLYARCGTVDASSCDLFRQIADMAAMDRKAAISALAKLVQVAASGQPVTAFYDKKQCHEIHSFRYRGKERTVWRIRKGDAVRVTFYYGEGRLIVLTHAFAKFENKLTTSQKAMTEAEVVAYIDASGSETIHFFEKQ